MTKWNVTVSAFLLAFCLSACGAAGNDDGADSMGEGMEESKAGTVQEIEETGDVGLSVPDAEKNAVEDAEDASLPEKDDAVSAEDTDAQESSVPLPAPKLVADVPEGFVPDGENMYVSAVEGEISNMNILETVNDGTFDQLGSELLLPALEAQLETSLETDVTLTLDFEKNDPVGEYRAYQYGISYEYNGFTVVQLQCIIEAPEKYHFVTYTLFDTEPYYDVFMASMESLRFE